MNFRRGMEKEPLEINLVPLIDVMLVILIFLMVTTTYSKYTELKIDLPTADTAKQVDRPGEVSVLVNAAGDVVVDKLPVAAPTVDALADALRRAAAAEKKPPVVVISADAKTTHQAVIRVMEAAQRAGLEQITFTAQATK